MVSPSADDAEFTYSGTELDALADAVNYYTEIVGRFAPCLRGHVVEVGAGIGTFSRFILALPTVVKLTAVEPAANIVDVLRARVGDDPRVEVVQGYLPDLVTSLESPVDAVVAVNVLEHVEDDAAFLHAAHDMLLPGGALLLFVPALPTLFGTWMPRSATSVATAKRRLRNGSVTPDFTTSRFAMSTVRVRSCG